MSRARTVRRVQGPLCATLPATGMAASMDHCDDNDLRLLDSKVDAEGKTRHQSTVRMPMNYWICRRLFGNDLLQIRIRCGRILLEQRTDLAVIGCEHGNGIVRWVSCLVIIGMDMLCHGRGSFHLAM